MKEDLEKMLKEMSKDIEGMYDAEIRVTPKQTHVRGGKIAILSLLGTLVSQLVHNMEGQFTEEDIREAVEKGLLSKEEKKKKAKESIKGIEKLLKEFMNKIEEED